VALRGELRVRKAQEFLKSFFSLLFFERCHLCGAKIRLMAEGVCGGCSEKLEAESPQSRTVLVETCGETRSVKARARMTYGDEAKKLVSGLKFEKRRILAKPIGRLMAALAKESGIVGGALVPIPLAKERLKARGFNQSSLVAAEISRLTGMELIENLLERTRDTARQVGLSSDERFSNMRDAFRARKPGVLDLVVVDDIITTGATFAGCAKALFEAGAARVTGLFFAGTATGAEQAPRDM
jgi:ComF family protein